MKLLVTLQSRVQSLGILLGIITSATLVLTASAEPTNCAPPPAGLVSWWRGEGNALDQAGGNNGVSVNGVGFEAGIVGQAFRFDGSSNSYVEVADSPALRLTNALTIECWAKRLNASECHDLVEKGGAWNGGQTDFGIGLNDTDPGGSHFGFSFAGGWRGCAVTPDTAWHHYAAVAVSGQANPILYIDGVPQAIAYGSGPATMTLSGSTRTLHIGALLDPQTGWFKYSSTLIDELAIFDRALSAAEIQAVYAAGGAGKCLFGVAPSIIAQPADQTVLAGATATFTVAAAGTTPLNYQWLLNGTNIAGATATSLLLTNVQLADAGAYSVIVTNTLGTASSSNATLTVNLPPPCAAAPAGLVSWWRGESNALDSIGSSPGVLRNGVGFTSGKVGQAFVFNGIDSYVEVPDAPSLQLTNQLTIEFWAKRRQVDWPTEYLLNKGGDWTRGALNYGVCFASPQYDNHLAFLFAGGNRHSTSIADLNWHHIAIVARQGDVDPFFYLDGVAQQITSREGASTINLYPSTEPLCIGAQVDPISGWSYYGKAIVDELSIYNRALGAAEIQAIYSAGISGKCVADTPPTITSQPASQTVVAGDNAAFEVMVAGTQPFEYQWNLDGSSLPGATNSSLVLTNVQLSQAGTYAVLVTNRVGSILSSNAVLTVNPPPPCAPPPAGLVSWWRGQGNALDQLGTANGTLAGNTSFGPGRVGQAFVFDGSGDLVTVGNPDNLQLQDFTIEAWIKRASTSITSYGSGGNGIIFGYGWGGYALYLDPAGLPALTKVGISDVKAAKTITDTDLHHLAVSKAGSTVVFYVDGVAYAASAYNPGFVFSTVAAIGARGDNLDNSFLGTVDEVAVYNRGLTEAEIQAVYNAGGAGKCVVPIAPFIISQPTNLTVTIGGTATFKIGVGGTAPLSCQWQFSGTNIAAATNLSLTLSNVQFAQAGNYAVWVTNAYGSSLSSNALLAVNPPPPCVPPPPGLVSWWRGESNAWDQAGVNPGVLRNGAGFGAGEVGQAFNFNGTSQYVDVTNSVSLNPTGSISVEAWIYPRLPLNGIAAPIIKKAGEGSATQNGYALELSGTTGVRFYVYRNGSHGWTSSSVAPLYTSRWSHVVGVFDGTNLLLYLNGALVGTPLATPGQIVPSGNNLQIGHDPCNTSRYFNGLIDEASVYNTALSRDQIQAIYVAGASGKCPVAFPPSILAQPSNQAVTLGASVTFSVTAAGTPPLSYQWSLGGSPLDGATNASLMLTNVQLSQAGNYSVVVTNAGGAFSSSNATLMVNFPPAVVRLVSVTNAPSGATVDVPVSLGANGNENGLSFSLNFDPAKLIYVSTAVGSGASGANLLLNTDQAASGKLGLILALAPDKTLAAGTQELVQVTFATALLTNAVSSPLSFGDVPIVRLLSDAPGDVLAASYVGGAVSIQAADFEGDVSPRPNGDKAILVTDWVMAGRYAARLDYPTNAAEFQRADCAPRSTLGDGMITVSDWVQVGRYAAGWDPLTAAGGPTAEVPPTGNISRKDLPPRTPQGDPPVSRVLEVADTMVMQGLTGTVSVQLESQGNENAVGFSLSFDPAVLDYIGASLGSAGNGATLFLNTKEAGAGRLGFVLALGTGSSFAAGKRELVQVTFRATAPNQGKSSILLANQPVPCEVSDTTALRLAAGYVNGTITVNPLPSVSIGRSGSNITLAWPLWATNFGLQTAEGGLPPMAAWTNLVAVPNLTSNEAIVTLPLAGTNRVYRLHQP